MMKKQDKLKEAVKIKLEPNEKIEVSVYGSYGSKKTKVYGGGILAATNKRIVFFSKGIFGEQLDTVSYSDVEEIKKKRVGILQVPNGITISVPGHTIIMEFIRKEKDIDAFINYVNHKLSESPAQDIPSQLSSEDIGKYIREENILALSKIFMRGDWNTRETISLAFVELIKRNTYPTTEFKKTVRDMLEICKAESGGGVFQQNCLDNFQFVLEKS